MTKAATQYTLVSEKNIEEFEYVAFLFLKKDGKAYKTTFTMANGDYLFIEDAEKQLIKKFGNVTILGKRVCEYGVLKIYTTQKGIEYTKNN